MSKAKSPIYKPGQKALGFGQYAVIGPKGEESGTEVTVTKGKRLPPTPKRDQGFVLVNKTKHKSDE